MLRTLRIKDVGPADTMDREFGSRLNVITGDNGLGKSFLLDIAWWALTRQWPSQVNKKLTSGLMARPRKGARHAEIVFSLDAKTSVVDYSSNFVHERQAWTAPAGRPWNPGLVLYAQSDGSFAVWDPARNYWKKSREEFDQGIAIEDESDRSRLPAYVFTPQEVWNGLTSDEGRSMCEGLLRDWAGWQKQSGSEFEILKKVLRVLSPSDTEVIEPGELTRISIDDARDVPTIRMPYGLEVPILHASAGIRRVVALAYLLVWSWSEHKKASKVLEQETAKQIIFLIDEIEAHLHPKWQRKIVNSLLHVMNELPDHAEVQIVLATHSPLVMASIEPHFKYETDAWFDLDYVETEGAKTAVCLQKRDFLRQGDVSMWLLSDAFDLKSSRSVEAEVILRKAENLLEQNDARRSQALKIDDELRSVLGELDPFWVTWRFIGRKKGWFRESGESGSNNYLDDSPDPTTPLPPLTA
ncbi:AAA family ATPase [bacterium]|nr:AAA family ATPase [bacterium]